MVRPGEDRIDPGLVAGHLLVDDRRRVAFKHGLGLKVVLDVIPLVFVNGLNEYARISDKELSSGQPQSMYRSISLRIIMLYRDIRPRCQRMVRSVGASSFLPSTPRLDLSLSSYISCPHR